MPSKSEVEIFELSAQYAAKCWVFGVEIDETNGLLFPTKNKGKLFAQHIFLAYLLVLVLFCIYRNYIMCHQISTNSADLGWFVVYVVLTIAHIVYLSLFAIFATSKKEMTNLWNQLLHYSRTRIDSKLDGKIREKVIWFGHYSLKFAMVTCAGIVVALPEYIFATRQEEWPYVIALGIPLIAYGALWLYLGMGALLIIYSVMFFISVNDALQMKFLEPEPIEGAIWNFKLLTLLSKNFNGAYALKVIPTAKYMVTLFAMICFYLAVRATMPNEMQYGLLALSATGFIYTILLTNVLSVIWSTSSKFIAQSRIAVADIEDRGRKMHLRRELRSLRPLRISVGGVYYMEAEAKLTFMEFVITGTANLLIAFK